LLPIKKNGFGPCKKNVSKFVMKVQNKKFTRMKNKNKNLQGGKSKIAYITRGIKHC